MFQSQPSVFFFAALKAICNTVMFLLLVSLLVEFNVYTPFLENSLRGPLVTLRASAIPTKYTCIIYEFCSTRQRHDI